jgi:methyl-accepting chemotaxis protein
MVKPWPPFAGGLFPAKAGTMLYRLVPRFLGTVRAKVVALAVVPLVGLLAVAVVELTTQVRVENAKFALASEADQAVRLKALLGDLYAARLVAEEFRTGLMRKPADDFTNITGRLLTGLKEEGAAGRWPSAERLIPPLEDLRSAFAAFVREAETLGLTESEGLNSELRLAGLSARHTVLGLTGSLGPAGVRAQQAMSDLAIAERELKTGRDMSVAGLIEEELRRVGQLVRGAALAPAVMDDLGAKLRAYQGQVDGWARQRTAADRAFGRFAESFTAMISSVQRESETAAGRAGAALAYRSSIDEERNRSFTTTLLLATVLAALLSTIVLRAFSGRFAGLIDATRRLAGGAMDVDLRRLSGSDEIAEMAGALGVFRDQAIERQTLVGQRADEAERRAASSQKVTRAVGAFETGIDETLANLRRAAGTLEEFSRRLDETSSTMSEKATTAGDETETSSAEIESVASAAQQLTVSVHEVATQALRSDQIAGQALADSSLAGQAMQELGMQTDRVGEIVGMIEAIAAQTNLLALNATIEAARAGEAGRGFAVVAQEVKALASQTAQATREIAEQIGGIRTASQRAAAALEGANTTMSELSRIAASVAAAVEEQSTAISSISQNVAAASDGASVCASAIRQVEAMAQDTRAEAARVSELARGVSGETERLSDEVRRFLRTVSAA